MIGFRRHAVTAYAPIPHPLGGFELRADLGMGGAEQVYPGRSISLPTNVSFQVPKGFRLRLVAPPGRYPAAVHVIPTLIGIGDHRRVSVGLSHLERTGTPVEVRSGTVIAIALIEPVVDAALTETSPSEAN